MTDAMKLWKESQARLNKMDPRERVWFQGFVEGLCYAQAAMDVEGGTQTIKANVPPEWWEPRGKQWVKIEDFQQKFADVMWDLDDEGHVMTYRFIEDGDVVEVGSSEGFHGSPNW